MSLPRLVIPSHDRSDVLAKKTFAFLERENYPKDKIIIFVSSEIEQFRYSLSCPGVQIVIGQLGLTQQRNFISDWLDDDEIYVSLDDDVTGVKTMGKSFLTIVRDGVQAISSRRTGLFGILSRDDGRSLKDSTTQHLAHIVGSFFIARNHKDIKITSSTNVEDYARSCLYFLKYGAVFRYRGAGVQTKYLGSSGGLVNRRARQEEGVQELVKMFPNLCRPITKRNGWPDVLLNFRAKI